MFTTALSVAVAIAFVLPGFLVAETARTRRGEPEERGDWAQILRALWYSVLIQLAFIAWTTHVVNDFHHPRRHTAPIACWGVVVVLVTPIAAGYLVGRILDAADARHAAGRRKPWWYYALGATDARDAWDFAFQNVPGSYVIVRTDKGLVAGKYSQASWAGQTPRPHDLYLEEVWTLVEDENGFDQFDKPMEPPYSVWLHQDTIKDIFFAKPPTA